MLRHFEHFCRSKLGLSNIFPSNVSIIAQFIAFLYSEQYSPSSILSYISAISFKHKASSMQDPTDSFFIRKILKGTRNLSSKPDSRLPITSNILNKLIASIPIVINPHFNQILLRAMFLLMYHAFLRVGEVTIRSNDCIPKVIKRSQIKFIQQHDNFSSLELTITDYKHSDLTPKTLLISSQYNRSFCPLHALHEYLHISRHINGPLFQFPDGSPVSRGFFTKCLKSILEFNKFDPKVYQTHSFRIGAASDAATRGVPMITIQHMGRWKSNAVKNYIRMQQMQT